LTAEHSVVIQFLADGLEVDEVVSAVGIARTVQIKAAEQVGPEVEHAG